LNKKDVIVKVAIAVVLGTAGFYGGIYYGIMKTDIYMENLMTEYEKISNEVDAFKKVLSETGRLQQCRAEQAKAWMWSEMTESLVADLKSDERVKLLVPDIESAVLAGELPATVGAQRVINLYKNS